MGVSWGHLVTLGVLSNIFFLSVTSQWLLNSIEGFALRNGQAYIFSFLCFNIFVCYVRCCLTDPGFVPKLESPPHAEAGGTERWCKKCNNVKPPRAHHCSHCKRCIPKMDHHCVWIVNCVSYRIFPHFLRGRLDNVLGMAYLQYFLFLRISILWSNRHLPSYLGPSPFQLVHLLLLSISNSITFFAIFLMFCKSLYTMMFNITTIEGWEIQRHAALVRRARSNGGFLYGPSGVVVYLQKQEFPYDIGIWKNIVQSMGTANVRFKILSWFWSFGPSLPIHGGVVVFETNGFEGDCIYLFLGENVANAHTYDADPTKTWPPPDPEKIPVVSREINRTFSTEGDTPDYSSQSAIDAFRQRQAVDLARQESIANQLHARRTYTQTDDTSEITEQNNGTGIKDAIQIAPNVSKVWKNSEGETLADFGVDEEAELSDDNIPLSKLIQNKKHSK